MKQIRELIPDNLDAVSSEDGRWVGVSILGKAAGEQAHVELALPLGKATELMDRLQTACADAQSRVDNSPNLATLGGRFFRVANEVAISFDGDDPALSFRDAQSGMRFAVKIARRDLEELAEGIPAVLAERSPVPKH